MKKIFETFKTTYKLGWIPFVKALINSTAILVSLFSGILLVVTTDELYLKILYGLMYGLISVIMFLIGASYLGSDIELHARDENIKLLVTMLSDSDETIQILEDLKDNVSDSVNSDVNDSVSDSVSTGTDA